MTSFGYDTTSVFPYMKNKIVSVILDDSTIEPVIIVTFSSTQLANNGLNLDRRVEENEAMMGPSSVLTSIGLTKTKKKFFRSITGCFDSVGSVDGNTSFWIDDKCCTWSAQGLDDHLSDTLAIKMLHHCIAINGFGCNEADELILNRHVDVATHSCSSCSCEGPVDEIISSGSGSVLSIARIAGRRFEPSAEECSHHLRVCVRSAARAPRNRRAKRSSRALDNCRS